MNEVADRLHPRPAAVDAAEVRPGEIGEQFGLAITAWPKERQRVRRKIRHGEPLRGVVDLILACRRSRKTRQDAVSTPAGAVNRLTTFP